MPIPKRALITAALPYSNGRLHVGHIVGAYLPADTYVRYLRMQGSDVRFVCGSDDHGVAIMLTALKENKTPAQVAEFYGEKQARDFAALAIDFDIYSSTSRNPHHAKTSQDFFKNMLDKGYFQKETTRQFYDESTKTFLPDRFVKVTCGYCGAPDQNSDQCEQCGKMLDVESAKDPRSVMSGNVATIRETVHWFLDLSRFEQAVRDWLKSAELRDHTRSYVEGLLSTGLVKRSMTRDLSWGIPLPIDDPDAAGKVLYVWFDAPIGYISNTIELCARGTGRPAEANEWWASDDCGIYHFIGEDNTIFHCVVWIAMLQAEGSYKLPRGVIVNQFMNIQFPGKEETKISKSRGSAVWIDDYIAEGGDPEALRYYLTLISTERSKTTYKPEDLIQRQNSELANVLGNFVNRILSFTAKNYGPQVPDFLSAKLSDIDREFLNSMQRCHADTTQLLDSFQFKAALERIMEFARACNKYVDDKAPWTTKKTDNEGTKLTLNTAIAAIKFLGIVLRPFMPRTSDKILHMLLIDPATAAWNSALIAPLAGSQLGEAKILFQKVETASS